jgi:hypothetical protein
MGRGLNLTNQKAERSISDIVGALTDPIIVHPGGWADTLSDWIKHAIIEERLVMNLKALNGEEITGTDAEACAYLHTASLCFPFDHDWTNIYLYIASRVYSQHRTQESGTQVPEDIRVEKLDDQQMRDLCRLKDWIYKRRVAERQERDRAERRQKREEAAAKKKAEQPVLSFEF